MEIKTVYVARDKLEEVKSISNGLTLTSVINFLYLDYINCDGESKLKKDYHAQKKYKGSGKMGNASIRVDAETDKRALALWGDSRSSLINYLIENHINKFVGEFSVK